VVKYLLLLALFLLAGYWLAKRYGYRSGRPETAAPPPEEDMVRCAQCGVHLPRSESLLTRGHYYCSAEHQRQHTPSN
jgi:uncharacterized protein